MSNILNTVVRYGTKLGVKIAKHSPDILVGVGIAAMGTSVVHACLVTSTKAEEIVEAHEKRIQTIEKAVDISKHGGDEFSGKFTEQDERRELAVAYTKTVGDIIKNYWAPITEFAVGAICICVAHRILNKRVLYLAASYNGLQKTYNTYRDRIKDEYGEEADIFGVTGVHKEPFEYTEVAEDGTQTEVKRDIRPMTASDLSDCAVVFDEMFSSEWTDNALTNLDVIKRVEKYYNDILGYKRDFVYWSDCLMDLGIWNRLPIEKQRRIIGKGWVYDPANPRKISFGIIDWDRPVLSERNADMIMGYEPSVWLDPNIDGDVASLL